MLKNEREMLKNEKKFLMEYINTPSPSGYEIILGGQKVWIEEAKKFAHKVIIDDYGNAYAYLNANPDGICMEELPTILLDAHGDEIGFFVTDITEIGLIKFDCIGGSDITIMPAARVDIWVDSKSIKGVVGHPAIHVHKRKFEAKQEEMFIDIGISSKKEVEKLGIRVGTPITMADGYMDLNDYICGRSLDDKIGGFINLKVLEELSKYPDRKFNLVVVNAVQEEVGLFGAKMAVEKIKPTVAIAIDVTHDVSTPAYAKEQIKTYSGKGVVIMDAPSIQKNVFKILVETAKHNNIPYQITASGRGSGTNADSYAYPHGIPTGLVKLALKYMHTTVEMVHKQDVKSVIELLVKVLESNELIKDLKYKI